MRRLFLLSFVVSSFLAQRASAQGLDLEKDDPPAPDGGFGAAAPSAPATIRARAYTLSECLALADRNHPNLWAARARVEFAHAQLSEARWVPYFQWSANASIAVLPPIGGTAYYNSAPATSRNLSFGEGLSPLVHFDINGVVPLYTFGKIDAGLKAAEANVRVNEWDLEKFRQQTRMDVRRAFFGLMLARDAKYVSGEIMDKLARAIKGIDEKISKGDKSVSEIDRIRLDVYREEIVARSGEADKGANFALAALRFFTGVQSQFDIPDEPLKRPDVPLAPIVRYLSAARLFRPEVNMARAGVEARKAQVDLARARFFPDFGLALGADFSHAPGVTEQNSIWAFDPFNHFYYIAGVGLRWSLDFLPNAARVAEAESQLEETRSLERLALGGLAVEVENAYATAVEAKGREEAWDRAEHKAKNWVVTIQDQIDLGTANENGLNEPLRFYVNARVNHLFALMDYNVALSQLALASGWDSAAPSGT